MSIPNIAERGSVQINDKNAIWRKLVPTDDGQVIVSDSSLDKGAIWKQFAYNMIPCGDEVVGGFFSTDQDNYSPVGYDSNTSVLLIQPTANVDITGIPPKGPTENCWLTIFNNGSGNAVLKEDDPASSANNRFAFGGDVTIKPRECIAMQYLHTLQMWCTTIGRH